MNAWKSVVVFLGAFSSLSYAANPPQWQIIPNQSSLTFTATQNGAPVTGHFNNFKGEIFVDPANYKASSIHITVDIKSVVSSYSDLTNTLETSDWFDAAKFPTAEFKSTSFNQLQGNNYEAMGNLTIKDKTLPVKLTFTAEETSPGMALVVGSTTLKRTAFNVGQGDWSSTAQVKDEVQVNFRIIAKKMPEK